MNRPLNWLGLAGSLRAGSYNRALLRAACELAPSSVRLDILDLDDIPLYNADLDTDELRPEPVRRLKQAVALADGLVLSSPEYNYGVSGVMKNAIDWASRPAYASVMAQKPVAIMGASMAATGGVRGQQALRGVLLGCLCMVYPSPDIAVAKATDKFQDGALVDPGTRERLEEFLAGFADFTAILAEDVGSDLSGYEDTDEPSTDSIIDRLSAG